MRYGGRFSIPASGVAAMLAACARAPTPVVPETDPCIIVTSSETRPITVAVTNRVDLQRVPATDDGRMVFAHLYETLVTVDCEGRPRPALATSWRSEDDGSQWTFVLRHDARLAGAALTAPAVVAAWGDAVDLLRPASVATIGDDRVVISYPTRNHEFPMALAAPALAVRRAREGSGPLLGTIEFEHTSTAGQDTLTIAAGTNGEVKFVAAPDADGRDLLDRGVDVLWTDEPQVLEYAAQRSDLTVVPLPWSAVYVARLNGWQGPDLAQQRTMLARDAVRIDARAAVASYWFAQPGVCDNPDGGTVDGAGGSEIIAYPAEDRTAQLLAERLMVLSAQPLSAAGVPRRMFRARMASAVDVASLVSLPIHAFAPCATLQGVPLADLVPLIETRAHLVIRSEAVTMTTDWLGTPLIVR